MRPAKRDDVRAGDAARAASKQGWGILSMVTLLGRRLGGRHHSGERHPEMFSRDPTIRIQCELGAKIGGSLIHHSPLVFGPRGSESTHLVAVIEAPLRAAAMALSGSFDLLCARLEAARV